MSLMRLGLVPPMSPANPTGLDILTDLRPASVSRGLADGTRREMIVQYGRVHVRLPESPNHVFHWEFLFDPTLPDDAVSLLGIGDRVLSDISLDFRGPAPGFYEGFLTVDIIVSALPADHELISTASVR